MLTDLLVLVRRHAHKDAHIRISNLFQEQGQWQVKSLAPRLLSHELLVVDQELRAVFDLLYLGRDLRLLLSQSLGFFSSLCAGLSIAKAFLHEVILLLRCLQRRETKVILHLQKVWSRSCAQELEELESARLGRDMDGCVAHVVFLEQLG